MTRSTTNIETFTGETILCLSSIDWDFNWQGHQEIVSRLADDGNRVLVVENTGWGLDDHLLRKKLQAGELTYPQALLHLAHRYAASGAGERGADSAGEC